MKRLLPGIDRGRVAAGQRMFATLQALRVPWHAGGA
jgi:hypothetical protein